MVVDILKIEPTVISRNLQGKFICIYGRPKVGKTTFACQAPKNLLLGFEVGWNALNGIKPVQIDSWADFKATIRQLKSPEAKEMYHTVTIDTIAIAWEMCEKFICIQNGVSQISDIPWGAGYKLLREEFASCLREITRLGYGIIFIAHAEEQVQKEGETEYTVYSPAIPKRAKDIVNQLVDIIGYIGVTIDSEGNKERYLYTRETKRVFAGTRFAHLAPKIKFGYQELVDAVNDAIDKEESNGATVVESFENKEPEKKELDFEAIREEAKKLWMELIDRDPANSEVILSKVESIFGKRIKLSEITKSQVELFNLVLLELRDLI